MARRGYRGRRAPLAGRSRALQHIEEAKQFSREIGGSDRDVKDYFFSLSDRELAPVLAEYGERYGQPAQEYAELTIPRWRSGKVTMSGMVAKRLFDLLPAKMPLAAKYKLTEDLWKHFGPSSQMALRVGADATVDEIVAAAASHISDVVISYRIPEELARRFDWLASGDVGVKQQILNYLRDLEKGLVIEAIELQGPIMIEHLRGESAAHTSRFSQRVMVGKHELELHADRAFSGVRLEAPQARSRSGSTKTQSATGESTSYGWVWWVLAAGLILYALSRA